jgi:hypothetical protein
VIIITMDTLALPAESVGERVPSIEGRRLWNLVFQQYSGSIILIADGNDNKDFLEHWLKSEGFKPSMIDYAADNTARSKVQAASRLRNAFGNLHWFVDIDPYSAKLAIEEGLPTLITIAPSVPRAEWRNDSEKETKSWNDLITEIDKQRIMRAEANWGEME